MDEKPSRGRGRRRGQNETRQAILEAARARFATDGFTGTTIRRIAADAEVDASLVIQFFKSKDELFGAVMSVPPAALACMTDAWTGPVGSLGQRVAEAFLGVWEDHPEASAPLLAMLRGAIAHEQAATQLRDFLEARLMKGAQPHLGDEHDIRLRMALAAAMLVGVVVARHIVRVPTVADEDLASVVVIVAPALQTLLEPRTRTPAVADSDENT